jgi:hypothetical protein
VFNKLDISTPTSTTVKQDDNVLSVVATPPVLMPSETVRTHTNDVALTPTHDTTPERLKSTVDNSKITDAQPQNPAAPQSPTVVSPEIDKSLTTAVPDHSKLVLQFSDKTQWPDWLEPAVKYLKTVSDAPEWARLVSNFIVLEGLMDFSTSGNVSC